jgi:2-polyprenyl-3-methyl-5-hydroxy-6-metoxy-1,4-benzoquinol methylase
MGSKRLNVKDRCHSGRSRFDLEWDDERLFPEVVYPDADFLFRRMNEATVESVNPGPGQVILDIGCGRGIDGVELARKGAVVIGLEPSPVMISHAKRYISESTVTGSVCGQGGVQGGPGPFP